MPTNDFLPFGSAAGANVMAQADYLALPARANGFSAGTANSAQLNKAWRQSSLMASALAQFIADQSGQSVTDDGTTATIEANLIAAIKAAGGNLFAVDSGTANAYIVTYTPALVARAEGQVLRFKVKTANTGASTFNDGVSAAPLVGGAHAALQGGELVANGDAWVQWNSSIGAGSYILLFCTGASEQIAPAGQSQQAIQMSQMAAVVGGVRNGRMVLTAASATATYTADELAVKSGLGGIPSLINGFNKTINLATTGAGGMDVGAAPVTGYVAIYAIYNPITGVSALLGFNATSAKAPEVYGGANMPAGYTQSALVSVWPTSSSLLIIGAQTDRSIALVAIQAVNTASAVAQGTSLSIASFAPPNARSCSGLLSINAVNANTNVSSTAQLAGQQQVNVSTASTNVQVVAPFNKLAIITQQTIYYGIVVQTSLTGAIIYLSGYDF